MENAKQAKQVIRDFEERKGKEYEDKLFNILEMSEENECRAYSYKTQNNVEEFLMLKKHLNSIPQEVKAKNILLNKASTFLNTSPVDCSELMTNIILSNGEKTLDKTFLRIPSTYLLKKMDTTELDTTNVYATYYNSICSMVDYIFREIYKMQLLNMSIIVPDDDLNILSCSLNEDRNMLYVNYQKGLNEKQKSSSKTLKLDK